MSFYKLLWPWIKAVKGFYHFNSFLPWKGSLFICLKLYNNKSKRTTKTKTLRLKYIKHGKGDFVLFGVYFVCIFDIGSFDFIRPTIFFLKRSRRVNVCLKVSFKCQPMECRSRQLSFRKVCFYRKQAVNEPQSLDSSKHVLLSFVNKVSVKRIQLFKILKHLNLFNFWLPSNWW